MSKLTADVNSNIVLIKQLAHDIFPDKPLMAALTVSQAILEGALLKSPPSTLAFKYCNLFGMKPGFIRTGTAIPGIVELPTNEYIHNRGMIECNQPFLSNLEI